MAGTSASQVRTAISRSAGVTAITTAPHGAAWTRTEGSVQVGVHGAARRRVQHTDRQLLRERAGRGNRSLRERLRGADAVHPRGLRTGRERAAGRGPGLYAESRFYRAIGRYRLFDNSNTWTAKALRAAGCPIDP